MAEAKKIGVYIYTGDGLGEALDMEALSKVATKEYKVAVCRTHPNLYSKEGVELIKKDIDEEGLNAIVIAGISPRIEYSLFDFPGVLVERVNLREGVVWGMKPASNEESEESKEAGVDEDIQMAAEDYLRMGIVKVQKGELPDPYLQETTNKRILVIGGGVTGLTAALEASKAGYEVMVVEKEKELGGFAVKFRKQLPTKSPFKDLEEPIVGKLIKEVEEDPKIQVRTETVVARIAGEPGDFTVTLKKPGEEIEFDVPQKVTQTHDEEGNPLTQEQIMEIYKEINKGRADILTIDPNGEKFGAVILASGWKPYEPENGEFAHLGYGKVADVISNVQFEEMAASGKIVRPSDGKPVQSVVFIQSPGTEDSDFPYSSSVTSLVALKHAKYIREENPDSKAYIIYQHMRTSGLYERFYKNVQDDEGIFLTKGKVISVGSNGSNKLTVDIADTLLGEDIRLDADLVVLGLGMVPTTRDEAIVNLAYRQGPEIIDLDLFGGYADSNFICFPYETRRTGIYAAGGVRRTMTIEEAMEDATGAALKAIQVMESVARGVAVHPRSGDMSFPDFFFQRCTQCKRCTEECPFGAIDDDEKGTPKPNPARCRRCGTCLGACPERIINFKNYNIDMIGSMVKCIEVPDEDEEKPRVIVFACENDAYPALDMAAANGYRYNPFVRVIPLRCLGSMNLIFIADALSKGIDGILLLGCKFGDDYQCHFAKGSELANYRLGKIQETLDRLQLEAERVKMVQISIDEYDQIPGIIDEFMEVLDQVGPNPFKEWA